MSKNKTHSADEEGFLRAFTDLWSDLELSSDVRCIVRIERTSRKGIIRLVVEAYSVPVDTQFNAPVASYGRDFPTAQVQMLSAALYASMIQIDRLIEDKPELNLD